MKAKLLAASHKKYYFPESSLYTPIQVGKSMSENILEYIGDDTGDNISDKNRNYCELTALYWAWRNDFFSENEYFGLVHYRRYFKGRLEFKKFSILSEDEICEEMQNYDVIVPKKRQYYVETIRSHYENAHYKKDLDELETVVSELTPEYNKSFNIVMNDTGMHLYNMFIMNKLLYDNYCTWLFKILFELEERIDISLYSQHQSRVFGFLSELLFNVWLSKNSLKVKEIPVVNLEGENNFIKAINLLKRKFFNTQRI